MARIDKFVEGYIRFSESTRSLAIWPALGGAGYAFLGTAIVANALTQTGDGTLWLRLLAFSLIFYFLGGLLMYLAYVWWRFPKPLGAKKENSK